MLRAPWHGDLVRLIRTALLGPSEEQHALGNVHMCEVVMVFRALACMARTPSQEPKGTKASMPLFFTSVAALTAGCQHKSPACRTCRLSSLAL